MEQPDPAIDIESYMPLIAKTARLIRDRIGGAVELDELISMGVEGLLEAAARLDPDRAAQFPGYARLRVRGHILDNLGNTAALPRRAWRRVRDRQLLACPRSCDPDLLDALEVTGARDPRLQMIEALDARRMQEEIEALPDDLTRELLKAIYVEGRTLSEAAAERGVSTGWASRLHQRGLAALREQLAAPRLAA